MPRQKPHRAPAAAQRSVLEYLRREDYRPLTQRQLLHELGLSKSARPEFRRAIGRLLEQGKIEQGKGGRVVIARARSREDRETPRRAAGIYRRRRGTRSGVVEPFDASFGQPIKLRALGGRRVREGEVVRVDVVVPEQAGAAAEGQLVEVLGPRDDPGVDVRAVSWKYGLIEEFSPRALSEARGLPDGIPTGELERRERFEDPPPVTIDGETAKDFDDAVAVKRLPSGGFRLFVHIADVAHFVAPGSVLDREARERGTSVYFPGTVLPMFPERLSNDLCSLVPGEDRLVQTAVLDLDSKARVRKTRYADGVIRSVGRLTYRQVGDYLDGKRRGHGLPAALQPMLDAANGLRRRLERRRHARGSIDFDLPEPEILLDVEGEMTGVRIEPRNRAHRLIEEFMLAANEAVAGYLRTRRPMFLYRVHEPPDPAKIQALAEFAEHLGLSLDADPESVRPGHIQRLLENASGRQEYPVIAQVALRSMKQARYSTDNVGHFGLAAPLYTHFTSPIRRYPDLVVHRLLRALRRHEKLERLTTPEELERTALESSRLERNAESAERELLAWKKIAFVADHLGEERQGVVTGVTQFGLFVQLTDSLVEGLLHVERLGNDYFDFVPARFELRGRSHGRAFRLGDSLRVRIDRVDTTLQRVDLSLADAEPRPERRGRAGSGRTRGAGRPGGRGARRGSRR